MKKTFNIFSMVTLTIFLFSCKKNQENYPQSANINVVNAVINGASISINASAKDIAYPYSNVLIPVFAGQVLINLSTSPSTNTPAITYYKQTQTVSNGENYSLFLSGLSPAQVDAVWIKDSYEYTYPDSVCGVRFINLSPGSNPISINIQGNPIGSEISGQAYLAYSGFKKYSSTLTNVNNGYTFEFHDQASGNLLTTYFFVPTPFHNVTLALAGPDNSPTVIQANDF